MEIILETTLTHKRQRGLKFMGANANFQPNLGAKSVFLKKHPKIGRELNPSPNSMHPTPLLVKLRGKFIFHICNSL